MKSFFKWFLGMMAILFVLWCIDHKDDQQAHIDPSKLSARDIFGGNDIEDCTITNESIAGSKWQSCDDKHYGRLVSSLRTLLDTSAGQAHAEVLNSTLNDAMRIHEVGERNYLKGFHSHTTPLWSVGQAREIEVESSLGGAGGILTGKPQGDENQASFAESARYMADQAKKQYLNARTIMGELSSPDTLAAECNDSVDAIDTELTKGHEVLDGISSSTQIDDEERNLRANYANMLIADSGFRLACFQDAAK